MLFVCYPKCSTCQKARKWLDENGIPYDLRDIKTENPTYEELDQWHKRSGLPLKKFFNTSGRFEEYGVLHQGQRSGGSEEELCTLP